MMKPLRLLVIFVLAFTAIVLALYLTNPTEADFDNWIETKIEKKSEDGSLGDKMKGVLKTAQAKLMVDYENHYFFSFAETPIGTEKHKYLGILGMWIEI